MGSNRTFEALITDFGGVLTTPLQEAMVRFAQDVGIELQDFVRIALAAYSGEDDALVVDFETGRIPEETFAAGFAERITEATGVEVAPQGLVRRIFSGLNLEDDMLTAVRAAKEAGFKTALLSNSWGEDLYPREVLDPLFDVMVISGEVGMRKPDPGIFTLTVDRLGVSPSRCVFVDDHPGHLQPAREVGMATIHHTSPQDTISAIESLLGGPLGVSSPEG